MKSRVKEITFEWKEGVGGDRLPASFSSWAAANSVLSRWSHSAPKDGSYDKVSFVVIWEDGTEYRGRHDLVHFSRASSNLVHHIRGHLEFCTGAACPDHMTDARYAQFLLSLPTHTQEAAAKMLETCSFEDTK